MSRRGYTLWELVLVVVLIAVVAALVLPRTAIVSERRVDAAARGIAAVLRRVRSEALVSARRHLVEFDRAAGAYRVRIEKDPLGAPGIFAEPDGSLGRIWRLPEGVSFAAIPEGGVEFRPDGSAKEAVLEIAADSGDRRRVRVAARRGEVRIE
jgi:prepilin-type N-terminal cleavage/methylation domain-containing protein